MTALGVRPATLDLRSLPGPGRLEAVVAAFDALNPGEALEVQSQEPLDPLLDRLQAERPGRFEWSLLDSGPEGRRFEILRRDTASEHRGIAEALERPHFFGGELARIGGSGRLRARGDGQCQGAQEKHESMHGIPGCGWASMVHCE